MNNNVVNTQGTTADSLLKSISEQRGKPKSILESAYFTLVALSGVIFLTLLVSFLFLILFPQLKNITEKRTKLQVLNTELESLIVKRDVLQDLDPGKLSSDLELVNISIPSDLDLSDLATLIYEIADRHNLKVESLSLEAMSNEKIQAMEFDVEGITVSTIIGPFVFSGYREDVDAFIEDWYTSDYALRFSEIQLREGNNDLWRLNLQILGYSMPTVKDVTVDAKLPVIKEALLEKLKQQ